MQESSSTSKSALLSGRATRVLSVASLGALCMLAVQYNISDFLVPSQNSLVDQSRRRLSVVDAQALRGTNNNEPHPFIDKMDNVMEADAGSVFPSGKPRFVLHVGPLKTGTTSIEKDLGKMSRRHILVTDNWHYLNLPRTYDNGIEIQPEINRLDFEDPEFFEKFKIEAKKLRKHNMNIIMVKEGYSVIFGPNPEKYQKLKEALDDDWDVTIVSGYRPYYDWIPSTWSQANKRNKILYKDPDTWPWLYNDHDVNYVKSIFPDHYGWIGEQPFFSDSVIDQASPHFPVHVINLYDPRGLRTVMFCDVLKAENSCQESIRLDEEEASQEVQNKGSLDDIHYDSIGLHAASKGLINMDKYSRYSIMNHIKEYVEEEMHTTALTGLPLFCPDDNTLDDFLERSIQLDAHCVPDLVRADPDREMKLREDFHNQKENNKFCVIDKDYVIEQKEWQEFFSKFR